MNSVHYEASEMAEAVHGLLKDCLYGGEHTETPKDAVISKGIVHTFGFDPRKIAQPDAIEKVKALIRNLPLEFLRGTDVPGKYGHGDWTFLNLALTKDGEQWGEQLTAEGLLCLACAMKLAGYCMPREFWSVLPGGVPYVWFSLQEVPDVPTDTN